MAAAVSGATAHATAASDDHAFPRTFHMFSCGSPSALARYDIVVGYHYCDVKLMRSLNPNGIFLLAPGLDPAKGGQRGLGVTYGAAVTWDGRCDTIVDGQAAALGCIPAFNAYWDLLHNADGSAAKVGLAYGHGGSNLADTTGKGVPEKIAKIFTYGAKQASLYGRGWDGVHSDNWTFGSIGASWYFGPNLDTDRNGEVDEQALLRRNWDTGLTRTGHFIRSYLPGKIVGGNGNWFWPELYSGAEADGWLRSANYTLMEHMQQHGHHSNPGSLISKVRRWLDYPDPYGQNRYMAVLQDATNCDGSNLTVAVGADPNLNMYKLNSCVLRAMRWGLTASLLTDVYYEIAPYNVHGARWWYDEFDGGEGIRKRGYLGKALGDPQQLANGVWRRDFANGIALNNSTSSTQTVSLETSYKRLKGTQNPTLNNGAQVTSVSIPEHDGIILLRTSTTGGGATGNTGTSSSYQVSSKSPLSGQTLSGAVNWEATATGANVSKIKFSIDGQLRWTEGTSPYLFNGKGTWDTTKETNGSHTLSLQGVASDGKVATSSITVTVSNGTATSKTPTYGATVSGAVRWEAVASGAPVKEIEFLVDGVHRWTEGTSPYLFNGSGAWDTTKTTNGSHTLTVRATATDGGVSTSSISVTVSN